MVNRIKWWLKRLFQKPIKESPVHIWFGLTYSSYAVLTRTVMEQMPYKWQKKMVELLNEANNTFEMDEYYFEYRVNAVDSETKRFIKDPLSEYRHPIRLKKKNKNGK
jgi:hypothetical protein